MPKGVTEAVEAEIKPQGDGGSKGEKVTMGVWRACGRRCSGEGRGGNGLISVSASAMDPLLGAFTQTILSNPFVGQRSEGLAQGHPASGENQAGL